jgi:hypothetical protein
MPEGLSDEVKNILKQAADTISSGLFNKPVISKPGSQTGPSVTSPQTPEAPKAEKAPGTGGNMGGGGTSL